MRHRIEFSDIATFTDSDIVSGNCIMQHALSGESLATDTLSFRVVVDTSGEFILADGQEFYTSDDELFLTSDGEVFYEEDYADHADYAPVKYYFEGKLINKTYAQKIERVGRSIFDIECVSAIGLLDNSIHPGGVYSGTPLSEILAEILAGIDYNIDPAVADIKIYGWLPYDTKRNNLQQITIATSIAVRNNSNGSIRISTLDSNTKGAILIDRLVVGAGINTIAPKKAIQVTEHYYSESDETIELYNDTFITEEIILFPEPVHSLSISGGTIISSSANHAVVQGAGAVVLTGKRYLHNTKQVTVGTLVGASEDNIVRVTDATLISPLNSKAVAEKLFDAIKVSKIITGDVLFGQERPGDVVDVTNPYTLLDESAIIKKMDISFGSFLKASSEFRIGYKPSGAITGFQHREMFTENGVFVVPEGITQMRIVLASGAQGGQGGYDGEDGGEATRVFDGWEPGKGGRGGEGGKAGSPSRILDILISVTPSEVMNYTIGTGGIGGLHGELGALGTDSTFGSYSSLTGSIPTDGYIDIMTGTAYAFYGVDGVSAANGGDGGYSGNGQNGGDLPPAFGGIGGAGGLHDDVYRVGGGGGSGAAFNTNGLNGGDNWIEPAISGKDYLHSGDGANGVTPPSPEAASRGNGGDGGHGGSGGGGAGGARESDGTADYRLAIGTPGQGGDGSQGAKGGDGFIIVYY